MKITVKKSSINGMGVFATQSIQQEETVELCHVLILPKKDLPAIDTTSLYGYLYEWDTQRGALALGYGSLYNHSANPNAIFSIVKRTKTIHIEALRHIKQGEEITIRYTEEEDLWFSPKKNQKKT